jgi:3-deoxy-D-manno-octulosonic-acid transferase
VLVPRYPGRVPVAELRRRFGPGLEVVEDLGATDASLVWLDRMGALADAYARSELGVVCGTFAPIGGHDLSEPLQLGAASLYGPHVERQRAMHAVLQPAGAVQVRSAAELADAVLALLDDPARREAMVAGFQRLSADAGGKLRDIAQLLLELTSSA